MTVAMRIDTLLALTLCLILVLCLGATAEPILWDTVGTDPLFDGSKSSPTPGERVGLVVSNFGEVGHVGLGSVNLDYYLSGEECGTRPEDRIYLYSSSPFVLIASESGVQPTNVELTTSINQLDDSKPYSWKPGCKPLSHEWWFVC